jgi:hypothetical protein
VLPGITGMWQVSCRVRRRSRGAEGAGSVLNQKLVDLARHLHPAADGAGRSRDEGGRVRKVRRESPVAGPVSRGQAVTSGRCLRSPPASRRAPTALIARLHGRNHLPFHSQDPTERERRLPS